MAFVEALLFDASSINRERGTSYGRVFLLFLGREPFFCCDNSTFTPYLFVAGSRFRVLRRTDWAPGGEGFFCGFMFQFGDYVIKVLLLQYEVLLGH